MIAGVELVVEHVRTEVADKTVEETVTTAGLGVHVGPDGETATLRLTAPENPFTPATTIIVDESDEPAGMVREF